MYNALATVNRVAWEIRLAAPSIGYDEAPPGSAGIQKAINWTGWIGLGICLVGFVAAGVAMAVGRHQGTSNDASSKLGWVMGGSIVVGSASALLAAVTG